MESPFRKSDISRNNKDRNMRRQAELLEDEYGVGPTGESYTYGTELLGMNDTFDPRPATPVMQPSGDDRAVKTGKRTNGADPTPGKTGA